MKDTDQVISHDLVQQLCEILPTIGRISKGFAIVTDREGRCLKMIDWRGHEVIELQGVICELAQKASKQKMPIVGAASILGGEEAWAIPIGEYVLLSSNNRTAERDKKMRKALSLALPLIASVAGGEAVLFDREGRRTESVNSRGKCNKEFIGKISLAAQKAMETYEPVIGLSMSVEGATAVRIPLTEEYGIGFNNEQTVLQKQKLINTVNKYHYARYTFDDIIGQSRSTIDAKQLGERVARSMSSVLIYGDTGTGKELFAQAIHNASDRSEKPFIAINCGAMPPALVEGNLFGYVDGAYTGAKKGGNSGLFEAANQGTIFLDEISEMEWTLQSKLLRVLQEKEVMRIGSAIAVPVDIRIIAATNKNLRHLVAEKLFREDLYYRLNVIELKIPPLRERKDDVEVLTRYFIVKYNYILGKMVLDVAPEVMAVLREYPWPGNIRELQNYIESALNVIGVQEQILEVRHLPMQLLGESSVLPVTKLPSLKSESEEKYLMNLETVLWNTERDLITKVLKDESNNRARTAKKLGISTTTLWRKMVGYGILQH